MERLSRSIWTAPTAESPRGTRWFYERSRGQYADELAKENTTAGRKKFRLENPSKQKFAKTDLAKFRMSWDQQPQTVSLGAQKCFARFMANLAHEGRRDPDETEFKRTIALGILFKEAEKLYGKLGFTGFRANVVTYAIARLSRDLKAKLPFDEIWNSKSVPEDICNSLKLLLTGVREAITNPPSAYKNITEWCKKDQCREVVFQRDFDLAIESGDTWSGLDEEQGRYIEPSDQPLVNAVKSIPAVVWFDVATWAKQTNSLYPVQRRIAFSIGSQLSCEKTPSAKQASSGRKLLIRARELGFIHPKLTAEQIVALNDPQLDEFD